MRSSWAEAKSRIDDLRAKYGEDDARAPRAYVTEHALINTPMQHGTQEATARTAHAWALCMQKIASFLTESCVEEAPPMGDTNRCCSK